MPLNDVSTFFLYLEIKKKKKNSIAEVKQSIEKPHNTKK